MLSRWRENVPQINLFLTLLMMIKQFPLKENLREEGRKCVCERERERERKKIEREREGKRERDRQR